jgi:hypothetical protein
MPNTSNNYDIFLGGAGTSSNNANAFPLTTGGGGSGLSTWEVVDDTDWTAQATSTLLTGAGTIVVGSKSVIVSTIGTPAANTTQVVNGSGLVHTGGGTAGSGGTSVRWDVGPSNFNPGEEILLEVVVGNVFFNSINCFHCFGLGSGTNFSNLDWLGGEILSNASGSVLVNHIVRGYSTGGGARTFSMATNVTTNTNYVVQIWYDGQYSARVAIADGFTDLLPQPVIGATAPFDANFDIGNAGTGAAVAPTASVAGIFGSALRASMGIAQQAGGWTIKRTRLSRPTRMV